MTPEIHSRDDFFGMLNGTAAQVDGLADRDPEHPAWRTLQAQLRAMQAWTANGANPTPDQIGNISIGTIAARELEPTHDERMQDLIVRLRSLNSYWRNWGAAATPMKKKAGWNPVILLSLGLYVVACCLPALEFKNSAKPNDVMFGAQVLAVGWSGIFAGVVAWYANPFWLAGMIFGFFRKPIVTSIIAVIGIVIGITVFADIGRELPGDEGDVTKTTIIRILPAFYVWIASMALLPFSGLAGRAGGRRD